MENRGIDMEIWYWKTQGIILVGAFDSFLTGFVAATFLNAALLGEFTIFVSACLIVLSILLAIGHHSAKLKAVSHNRVKNMKKFEWEKQYRATHDYHHESLPLVYDLKKGDIVIFKGKSFGGTVRFYKALPKKIRLGKGNYRFESPLVIMDAKTAFRILIPVEYD